MMLLKHPIEVVIVSNVTSSFINDVKLIINSWKKQPKINRLLDLTSVLGIIVFLILFILLKVLHIDPTIGNVSIVIYPLLVAGATSTLRTQIAENPESKDKALYHWLVMLIAFTILVAMVVFLVRY